MDTAFNANNGSNQSQWPVYRFSSAAPTNGRAQRNGDSSHALGSSMMSRTPSYPSTPAAPPKAVSPVEEVMRISCIGRHGVAYRRSPGLSDRLDGIPGPALG